MMTMADLFFGSLKQNMKFTIFSPIYGTGSIVKTKIFEIELKHHAIFNWETSGHCVDCEEEEEDATEVEASIVSSSSLGCSPCVGWLSLFSFFRLHACW